MARFSRQETRRLSTPRCTSLTIANGYATAPLGGAISNVGTLTLTAVAALGGLAIRDVPQTLTVIVCAGLGNAALTANDWPFLTELVPAMAVGLFAGRKAASESVALPVSVALASALIGHWGYRACFPVVDSPFRRRFTAAGWSALHAAGRLVSLPWGMPRRHTRARSPATGAAARLPARIRLENRAIS